MTLEEDAEALLKSARMTIAQRRATVSGMYVLFAGTLVSTVTGTSLNLAVLGLAVEARFSYLVLLFGIAILLGFEWIANVKVVIKLGTLLELEQSGDISQRWRAFAEVSSNRLATLAVPDRAPELVRSGADRSQSPLVLARLGARVMTFFATLVDMGGVWLLATAVLALPIAAFTGFSGLDERLGIPPWLPVPLTPALVFLPWAYFKAGVEPTDEEGVRQWLDRSSALAQRVQAHASWLRASAAGASSPTAPAANSVTGGD